MHNFSQEIKDFTIAQGYFPSMSTEELMFGLYSNHNAQKPSRFITFSDLVSMARKPLSLAKDKAPAIVPHCANGKQKEAILDHDSMVLCWCFIFGLAYWFACHRS